MKNLFRTAVEQSEGTSSKSSGFLVLCEKVIFATQKNTFPKV